METIGYVPRVNRIKRVAMVLGATGLLAGTCTHLFADAKVNPFDAIAERNPFGLKDPPPPPPPEDPSTKAPPPPLATVDLTGILNILGPPQALLEIVPGPGKPMIKPVLREGERVESVEVVSINIQKNEVTIKNGLLITNLTFKVAKSTPAAAPPQPGVVPGMAPKPPAPTQTSYNNPGSGRYNVMVAGGAGAAAPASPTAPTAAAAGSGNADAGFRSIPSRNIRTGMAQTDADPAAARLQNFEEIEHNRAVNYLQSQLKGTPMAPLPPTPFTPPDAPGMKSSGFPPPPVPR